MIRTLAITMPPGFHVEPHIHEWGQLVYATSGAMSVKAAREEWLVPASRAVWIPPCIKHSIACAGLVRLRTLYIEPVTSRELTQECYVLSVAPLLRELVLRAVEIGPLHAFTADQAAMAGLILSEIRRAEMAPLALPMPRDARTRFVADRVRSSPGNAKSLAELAQGSGASPRTLQRLFVSELGMTFGRWRQQARLMHAIQRLAEGASVAEGANSAGYESTSAFIAMCRRALGTTPGMHRKEGRSSR